MREGQVVFRTRLRDSFAARRPLDGLQRWQMFMIIITLVFSQLLVNIWMFYAKVRRC